MITLPKRHTVSPLGHSADIALWLHVGDRTISLAQTAPTTVMLDGDCDVPIGPAKVEVINDGVSFFRNVRVTGRKAGSLWIDIVQE